MSQVRKRLRAVAHGRVQGVMFRDFVYRHARSLGVSGFVRNLPGGQSIELCAEGPFDKLQELFERFAIGPPRARVDRTEETWSDPMGEFASFEVRN